MGDSHLSTFLLARIGGGCGNVLRQQQSEQTIVRTVEVKEGKRRQDSDPHRQRSECSTGLLTDWGRVLALMHLEINSRGSRDVEDPVRGEGGVVDVWLQRGPLVASSCELSEY